MLEQFLPFLSPKNEFQSNANYVAGLYGVHSLLDRMFPSDKEKLEALLARKQIKALEASEEAPNTGVETALARLLQDKINAEKIFNMPKKDVSVLQSILKTYQPGVTSEFVLRRAQQMTKPKNILRAAI